MTSSWFFNLQLVLRNLDFTFLDILGSFPRMCFMNIRYICFVQSVCFLALVVTLKTGSAHLVPIDRSLLGMTTDCKKRVCVN